ncbi:hypothetical protein STAS_17307, partial [Striga asiatica]
MLARSFGRDEMAASKVVKRLLASSQLLTTRARCTPSRIVKIGPYVTERLASLKWGSPPVGDKRWRCPVNSRAPPTSGGDFRVLVFGLPPQKVEQGQKCGNDAIRRMRCKIDYKVTLSRHRSFASLGLPLEPTISKPISYNPSKPQPTPSILPSRPNQPNKLTQTHPNTHLITAQTQPISPNLNHQPTSATSGHLKNNPPAHSPLNLLDAPPPPASTSATTLLPPASATTSSPTGGLSTGTGPLPSSGCTPSNGILGRGPVFQMGKHTNGTTLLETFGPTSSAVSGSPHPFGESSK